MNRGWMVAGVLALVAAPAVPAAAAGVAMVLERVDDPAGMLRWIRTGDVLRYEVRFDGMARDARLAVAATPAHSLTGLSCARARPADTPDPVGAGVTARTLASRALAAPEGTSVPGASACRLGDVPPERAVQVVLSVPSGAEEVELAAVARLREDDGGVTTVARTATTPVTGDPAPEPGPVVLVPESGAGPEGEAAGSARAQPGVRAGESAPDRREVRAEAGGLEESGRGRAAEEAAAPERRPARAGEQATGVDAGDGRGAGVGPGTDAAGDHAASEVAGDRGTGVRQGRSEQETGGAGDRADGQRGEAGGDRAAGVGRRREASAGEAAGVGQSGKAGGERAAGVGRPGEARVGERGVGRSAEARVGERAAGAGNPGEAGAGERAAPRAGVGEGVQAEPGAEGAERPLAFPEGEPQLPEVAPPVVTAEAGPGAPLPRVVEGAQVPVRAERVNPLVGAAGLPYVAGGIGVLLAGLWAVAKAQTRRMRGKVF